MEKCKELSVIVISRVSGRFKWKMGCPRRDRCSMGRFPKMALTVGVLGKLKPGSHLTNTLKKETCCGTSDDIDIVE